MLWRPTHHKIIIQVADALTTMMSFGLSYILWCQWRELYLPSEVLPLAIDLPHILLAGVATSMIVILFAINGAYSHQRLTSFGMEVRIIFKTVFIGYLMLMGLVFLAGPGFVPPRVLILFFMIINVIALILEKALVFLIARILRSRGSNRKSVLVVGTEDLTQKFVEVIQSNASWGLDIVGFLDHTPVRVGQKIYGKKILGTFQDITQVLHSYPFDEVIITVSVHRMEGIRQVVDACEVEGVGVRIMSNFLGKVAKNFRADLICGLPIISISYIYDKTAALAIKRLMDITISGVLLVLLAPIFGLIALAIKITSPGPVFFELTVLGFNKKPFKTFKFRTMVKEADKLKDQLLALNEMEGPVFKIKNDPRVTPIGKFLRKYSLDELPQLWSVLKGDLSLVGPRAALPQEVARYESWHRRKLSIKPGLTCLWQIRGRNEINRFDDWVDMDLEYIDNWSLWLDLKILFKTMPVVLSGRGAS